MCPSCSCVWLFSLPQILERTLEPDSSDEEPPPVYSPPSYEMHIYDRKYPADVPPFPPPRQEENRVVDLTMCEPHVQLVLVLEDLEGFSVINRAFQ